MSLKIAPDVQYLSRVEWGADESLPRLGEIRPADEPTEAIGHHVVATDDDLTPNRWESVAEIVPRMQGLQTARPDLGLDIPYSYVFFLMQYAHKKGLILCEGRGPYRRGAHTKYHNRTGRAVAIYANTEIGLPLDEYVEMISGAWTWIKQEHGLVNLGTVTPARGGIIYAHRDFPTAATVCPGKGMMAIIDKITIDPPPQEEDDMVTLLRLGKSDPLRWTPYTYVTNGFKLRHVTDPDDASELFALGVWPDPAQAPLTSRDALEQLNGGPL